MGSCFIYLEFFVVIWMLEITSFVLPDYILAFFHSTSGFVSVIIVVILMAAITSGRQAALQVLALFGLLVTAALVFGYTPHF